METQVKEKMKIDVKENIGKQHHWNYSWLYAQLNPVQRQVFESLITGAHSKGYRDGLDRAFEQR